MRASLLTSHFGRLPSLLALLTSSVMASAPATQPDNPSNVTTQPGNVVLLQPEVRIDYAKRQVEVDGEVVLREGLLELFACSPGTREYESIVRLKTRPVVVFQALGLLGLEPGRPLRMDPETYAIIPATGDSLAIDVQYESADTQKIVPIETWMRHSRTKAPLEPQPWVFAGSFPVPNGAIAADEEGTIIAVVDFESALVALPRSHTANNEQLWLEPNTPAIPDVGTRCTVIFRPGPLRLRLDSEGRLYLGTQPVTLAEAARKLRAFARENKDASVDVQIDPDAPDRPREALRTLLDRLQIEAHEQVTTRPATTAPALKSDGQTSAEDPNAVPRWLMSLLAQGSPREDGSPLQRPAFSATQPAEKHSSR